MSLAPLSTLFGLGRAVPKGAGTVGSLVAIPLGFALHWAGGFPLFAAGLVLVTALGWMGTGRYLEGAASDDPGEVIVDEVAGQMVALIPLSLGLWLMGLPGHIFPYPGWVGGFLLFRFFDIVKPWPVSRAERLPGAAGVMMDDLVAGAIVAVITTLGAAVAHGWI